MADVENAEPNADSPCTLSTVQEWLKAWSALPPPSSLRTAPPQEISSMIGCATLHPFLPTLLPALFDESDTCLKASRLESATLAIIALLDAGTVPDSIAKKVADWIIGEVQALTASQLLTILDVILSGLGAALQLPTAPRAYHLLPTVLSLLDTLDNVPPTVMLDGKTRVTDGASIAAYALKCVLGTPWAAASLVPLATMLRDISLEKSARQKLLSRMTSRFSELEPMQMPALTYQLLLLADADGKLDVLRALSTHFDASEGEQWLMVQGTVILHVQFAVKQDPALGMTILKQAKAGQLTLGRFSFALLLTLARVGERFEQPVLQWLASSFRETYELRAWSAASPWLSQAASSLAPFSPDALLAGTVRSSATASFDHLVPSLISLAAVLVDEAPPGTTAGRKQQGGGLAAQDSAMPDGPEGGADGVGDVAAQDNGARHLPVSMRMVLIGRSALHELFRMHSMVRPTVIDTIIDRLISRGPAVNHWVAVLDELVRTQPIAVLEHHQRIRQLLEYVLALPPAVATAMLTSLLPLQQQKPELRDHLVLLLRKAMFSREETTRLTAVHGFLLLLHTTPSPGLATASDAVPQSAVVFQLELLGFIRRSLTQQASIRRALYTGVVPAFVQQAHLRPMIFELLLAQLASYTDLFEDDDTSTEALSATPLKVDACVTFSSHDESATLVEPLPQLIHAITQCMLAQEADGADAGAGPVAGGLSTQTRGEEAGCLTGVRARMRLLIDRLGSCTLKHFGLQGDTILTAKDKNGAYHHAHATFLAATLEALLDHTLLCHVGDRTENGGMGDADAPIFMATQAPVMTAASSAPAVPFGQGDPGVDAARKLFVVGTSLRDLVASSKVKIRKPLPPWLQFDLSLCACIRVLTALQGEAAPASAHSTHQRAAATSKRFARHVLKAISARTKDIALTLASSAIGGDVNSAHSNASAALVDAGRALGQLLQLVPHAEAISGKEAPSGMRNAYTNPLTGRVEKPSAPVSAAKGGKATKSGSKGDGSSSGAAAAGMVKSRLLLLLEAIDATVALLAAHVSPDSLSAALANAAASLAPPVMYDEDGDGDGDGDAHRPPPLAVLVFVLHPLIERLVTDDSSAEAEMALSIAKRLSLTLPASSLSVALSWSGSDMCLNNGNVLLLSTSKALFSYHLALTRRATPDSSAVLSMCKYILAVLGDNLKEEEVPAATRTRSIGSFALLTERSASHLSVPLMEALSFDLADLDHALLIRKRCGSSAAPRPAAALPEADDQEAFAARDGESSPADGLTALEDAICARETQIIDAMRVLCKAQLESVHAQALLTRCARVFKHQTSLFAALLKWLPSLSGVSPYTRLIEQLCGEESLCSAMYGMIAYVGACDQNTKTAARAKREAKLIPELVYAIDKFEAAVVTLAAKSKVDLLRLMKRATARDFRIQVNEVATKLKMLEATRRQEEKERHEKEGRKRKREAEKATGGKRGKAKASTAADRGGKDSRAGPPVVALDEDDDDDDDDEGEEDEEGEEGEEGEDGYPASMLDEDEELDADE